MISLKRLLCVITAGFIAQSTFGLDVLYNHEGGMEYISNVYYTPDNEVQDSRAFIRAGASLLDESTSYATRTEGSVEFYEFFNNSYESDPIVRLNTANTIFLSSSNYRFNIDDHFNYIPLTIGEPDIPTNRQRVNLFSTGPDMHYEFSTTNYMDLGYRYERYYEEKSNADSMSDNANLRIGHRISAFTSAFIEYTYQDLDYADVSLTDYKRQDIYFRYERVSTRTYFAVTDYYLAAGLTRIHRVDDSETEEQRYHAGLIRQINTTHGIGLHARHELSTNARELSGIQVEDPASLPGGTVPELTVSVTDLFLVDALAVDYRFNNTQNRFQCSLEVQNTEHISNPLLTEEGGIVSVEYGRHFADQSISLFTFLFHDRRYPNQQREDNIFNVGYSYTYQYSRGWYFNVSLNHEALSSNLSAEEYTVNRLLLSVRYSTPTSHLRR